MDGQVGVALLELGRRLEELGDVQALWVAGSLATGDYAPGVSDLDLVAVTSERLTGQRVRRVAQIHEELDSGVAQGLDLGCQYADRARLRDAGAEHPTWTHGLMLDRSVSLVTRAELVLHGYSVWGPPPGDLLGTVTPDDVRRAAEAELAGYWSSAARRPWVFVRVPVMVDLGLTAMARGRHAATTGSLLTKTAAIEQARAPEWLRDQMRARRRGAAVASPRWRAGYVAWRDVRETTTSASSPPRLTRRE